MQTFVTKVTVTQKYFSLRLHDPEYGICDCTCPAGIIQCTIGRSCKHPPAGYQLLCDRILFFNRYSTLKSFLTLTLALWLLLAGSGACAQAITLIGEDDWYPYAAFKENQLRGFAVEVIQAAYAAVNVSVSFKTAPYARCLKLVQTGGELGCFDSLKEDKLTKDFLFHHEPIFKAEIGIYALTAAPDAHLNSASLKGHSIGMTHGYTYTDEIENDPDISREVAPSDRLNLRKLLLKRSDYSLVYTRVADYLVAKYPQEFKGKIKQVGLIKQDNLYVSFSKTRADAAQFAALLDKGLLKIKSNGKYAEIEQRWRIPPL